MTSFNRVLTGTTALAILAAPLPALAHSTLEVATAPANSTYKAVLRVPHGCDGQATETLTVTIPEGVIDVKPMPKAGWTLETTRADFARTYELWGNDVSSGVTEVRWTGGSLPDDFYDEFVFRGRITGFAPGTAVPFKVVQTCADGAVAWDEIAAEGQDPHDLAHPAPVLTIAQAEGHGHGGHAGHGAADAAAAPGAMHVDTAWMRQPPPGASVAGGYMVIRNAGEDADRLIGGAVPFAERFEIHEMKMEKGMMQMREVEGGLVIPAGGSVDLAPGAYHIMMMGLTDTPKAGDTIPMTLEFEKAGTVEVELIVESMGATRPSGNHGGHSMHKAR